jgi:hypothetical protein
MQASKDDLAIRVLKLKMACPEAFGMLSRSQWVSADCDRMVCTFCDLEPNQENYNRLRAIARDYDSEDGYTRIWPSLWELEKMLSKFVELPRHEK